MKDKIFQDLTPEVREKAAKNLVYVGMIGIVMLFAGLSSAYIVSMGDSFWVKFPLPFAFWVSTAVIVLGSLLFQLAIMQMKKGNSKIASYLVLATTLTGVLFGITQYLGYKHLVDKGAYVVSNILVSNGRYGDYFEIRMDNALLVVDGNDFYKRGELLNSSEMNELMRFATKFLHTDTNVVFDVADYGTRFSLTYHAEPLTMVNGKLIHSNGEELKRTDLIRLNEMMNHIAAGRGDFFLKGKVGKDFKLYYHSEEVKYENRELFFQGKRLSKGLELKLIDSRDNATSYLYIITILHLAHILFMVGYMILFTKRTFSGEFSKENTLGMRATAIFWHFLGALWIYLLLFLLFIH